MKEETQTVNTRRGCCRAREKKQYIKLLDYHWQEKKGVMNFEVDTCHPVCSGDDDGVWVAIVIGVVERDNVCGVWGSSRIVEINHRSHFAHR